MTLPRKAAKNAAKAKGLDIQPTNNVSVGSSPRSRRATVNRVTSALANPSAAQQPSQLRLVNNISDESSTEEEYSSSEIVNNVPTTSSVMSSTARKSSNVELVQNDPVESSTGQPKTDTIKSSAGQKRARSGDLKNDTVKSSTQQGRSRSGQAVSTAIEPSIGQKRSLSGQVKILSNKSVVDDQFKEGFAKFSTFVASRGPTTLKKWGKRETYNATIVAEYGPTILQKWGTTETYFKFLRWFTASQKHVMGKKYTELDLIGRWMKRKVKNLEYKITPRTCDSFALAPYETPEAFYQCVSDHYPLIFERLEQKTAYRLFMSWLEKAKKHEAGYNVRDYIMAWMDLIAWSYDFAEGEEEKEGPCRRNTKYKWVRCQDAKCPHKANDLPEEGHTHFYDPYGNPATETLMLYDVGLVTFNYIMPAGNNWENQLPLWPANPTLKIKRALWTEADRRAEMKAKGLDRKYANVVNVEDEQQERANAMSNDYDDADEVDNQEVEDPNLYPTMVASAKTRKPRNAPKAAKAPQTATDPNAQTADTEEIKKWGKNKDAPKIDFTVGEMLSKALQDTFCNDYTEENKKKLLTKKRPGTRFVFQRLPGGIPDEPYPRKTEYFNYKATAAEEDMDTRAKFNLPLSAKRYAEYYEQWKLAKEKDRLPPYDRNWLQNAGIHEGAASSASTSLVGLSGIKLEDFDQTGVLIPGDILYIRYNVAVPPMEEASSGKRTTSKKKGRSTVELTCAELYTSQKTYSHEISARLIAFATKENKKGVLLHVNGFVDKKEVPLVVHCIGPLQIAQTLAQMAPGIETSRPEGDWQMIEVRSETGEEFGSLYRMRQHYELFRAEMDDWANEAKVEWRKMAKNSLQKREEARVMRAEGVMNGKFVKKAPKGKGKAVKKLSPEEQEAKAREKEAKTKEKEEKAKGKNEVKANKEAQSKGKETAKTSREAKAKEKEAAKAKKEEEARIKKEAKAKEREAAKAKKEKAARAAKAKKEEAAMAKKEAQEKEREDAKLRKQQAAKAKKAEAALAKKKAQEKAKEEAKVRKQEEAKGKKAGMAKKKETKAQGGNVKGKVKGSKTWTPVRNNDFDD